MTEVRVRMADAAVEQGSVLLTTVGLGSCVAIALHDAGRRVGGLAHILLPSQALSRDHTNRAKFPATAVPLLLERMCALGARRGEIVAKLVGGASMFTALLPANTLNIGERNLIATRAALAEAGIRIIGEDVGGEHGRNVRFHVESGVVGVHSIAKGDVIL
jgi:chemotaxis protein CheD